MSSDQKKDIQSHQLLIHLTIQRLLAVEFEVEVGDKLVLVMAIKRAPLVTNISARAMADEQMRDRLI